MRERGGRGALCRTAAVLLCLAALALPATAFIPSGERIERAAAEGNAAAGRSSALRIELELRIDVFVLQLGETVDELQDAEASGRLQALCSLADALVERCTELGYESLAEVAGQITAACREENPVAAHKAVVDSTELSKRVRRGHCSAAS